jgi:hypothetical protein
MPIDSREYNHAPMSTRATCQYLMSGPSERPCARSALMTSTLQFAVLTRMETSRDLSVG